MDGIDLIAQFLCPAQFIHHIFIVVRMEDPGKIVFIQGGELVSGAADDLAESVVEIQDLHLIRHFPHADAAGNRIGQGIIFLFGLHQGVPQLLLLQNVLYKDILNPFINHHRAVRLHDKIIRPVDQSPLLVLSAFRGGNYYRDIHQRLIASYPFQCFKAIHDRHDNVQDDNVHLVVL